MKKILILCLVVLTACHKNRPTAPYKITNVAKDKTGVTMDIQVNGRLTKPEMILIGAKVKSDSSQYDNLKFNYLLPGNNYENAGGTSIYATVIYDKGITAADTVKDADDNLLSFQFVGFTPEKAKKLLALDHSEMADKTVMGKFIDDNTSTVSIIYQDRKDANQYYVLELDTAGKVISAIAPVAVAQNGLKKFVVSQQGDYMTLKDSILTLYSSDNPNKPFRSIKQGI